MSYYLTRIESDNEKIFLSQLEEKAFAIRWLVVQDVPQTVRGKGVIDQVSVVGDWHLVRRGAKIYFFRRSTIEDITGKQVFDRAVLAGSTVVSLEEGVVQSWTVSDKVLNINN